MAKLPVGCSPWALPWLAGVCAVFLALTLYQFPQCLGGRWKRCRAVSQLHDYSRTQRPACKPCPGQAASPVAADVLSVWSLQLELVRTALSGVLCVQLSASSSAAQALQGSLTLADTMLSRVELHLRVKVCWFFSISLRICM